MGSRRSSGRSRPRSPSCPCSTSHAPLICSSTPTTTSTCRRLGRKATRDTSPTPTRSSCAPSPPRSTESTLACPTRPTREHASEWCLTPEAASCVAVHHHPDAAPRVSDISVCMQQHRCIFFRNSVSGKKNSETPQKKKKKKKKKK